MAYAYGLDKRDFCIPEDTDILDYSIIRELTRGSKTSSFLAEDKKDGKKVTLTFFEVDKIYERSRMMFLKNFSSEEAEKKAIQAVTQYVNAQEEMLLRVRSLEHENIARLYYFAVIEDMQGKPYMVSEYTPGYDFFTSTRGFNPLQMISLFMPLLYALDFMHQDKLLHLNLKPSKIRVDTEQSPPVVKLTDFGLAFPLGSTQEHLRGTANYMSPEAILEHYDKVSESSDLYSFAVLAYYCLTGKQPFPLRADVHDQRPALVELVKNEEAPSSLTNYKKDIPRELNDLILKLLRPNVEEREFLYADVLIRYFRDTWPEASSSMPFEKTSTIM